jgi:hypothetical protein
MSYSVTVILSGGLLGACPINFQKHVSFSEGHCVPAGGSGAASPRVPSGPVAALCHGTNGRLNSAKRDAAQFLGIFSKAILCDFRKNCGSMHQCVCDRASMNFHATPFQNRVRVCFLRLIRSCDFHPLCEAPGAAIPALRFDVNDQIPTSLQRRLSKGSSRASGCRH